MSRQAIDDYDRGVPPSHQPLTGLVTGLLVASACTTSRRPRRVDRPAPCVVAAPPSVAPPPVTAPPTTEAARCAVESFAAGRGSVRRELVVSAGAGAQRISVAPGVGLDRTGPIDCTVVDLNGDGRDDVIVPRSHCTGNCFFAFFLSGPGPHNLAYHRALSRLANPAIDATGHRVESFESRGLAGGAFGSERYDVVGHSLRPVRRIEQDVVDGAELHRTVRVRRGGAMTLVCEVFSDLEGRALRFVRGDAAACDSGPTLASL